MFFKHGISRYSASAERTRVSFLKQAAALLIPALTAWLILIAVPPTPAQNAPAVSPTIVISQVYGGAGCGTAGCSTYKNDYIELLNRGTSAVSLNGWSVQYAAATGTAWQVTTLANVSLAPGQYYLVAESAGANGVNVLPTPDTTGTIAMSATAAKVALVNSTTALSGACPTGAGITDFVGYGTTASCFEGAAPAPAPSTTTADLRAGGGCTDTDQNGTDFATGTPTPRNTGSSANVCGGGGSTSLSGSGAATPNVVAVGDSTLLTVTVTPATTPASTGITVTGNLTVIGGSGSQQFYDDGSNGDDVAGDNIFSFLADLPATVSGGGKNVSVSIADAQSRTASTAISLTVTAAANPQEHLLMGNPSNATTDVNNPFNYLLNKSQYAVSYHRDRAIPNWVSWHLDTTWIGSAARQNDFRPDTSLPAGWYQVLPTDYSGSGFDRGHNCPSGDRTRTIPDNSATFFMSNMMPQAPDNNQGPWEVLESYSRTLAGQGNELYIIAGSVGSGGTGSNGGVTTTLQGGKITVPAYTWKVILVLPNGDNDVSRVTTATRTIAVIMPNVQGIRTDNWQKYLATVDQVESLTGYDFYSNVPVGIQNVIESKLDTVSQAAAPQTVAAGSYTNLDVTDTSNKQLTGNITVTGNLNLGGTNLATGNFCVTLGANAVVTRTYGYINNCVERQFTAVTPTKPAEAKAEAKNEGHSGRFDQPDAPTAATEYPVGTESGYSPVFAAVTALGQTPSSLAVRAVPGAQPNAPDPNLALKRYWALTETGDLTANLTFKYLDQDVPVGVSENSFTLQKYEGAFTTVPATIDTAANTATANNISQFSDWTLLAPSGATAAGAEVGGRIANSKGRAIPAAIITLTDAKGNTYSARTNVFGYYRFSEIPAGGTYILNARHKSYRFTPQIINVTNDLDGVDLVGFPGN